MTLGGAGEAARTRTRPFPGEPGRGAAPCLTGPRVTLPRGTCKVFSQPQGCKGLHNTALALNKLAIESHLKRFMSALGIAHNPHRVTDACLQLPGLTAALGSQALILY